MRKEICTCDQCKKEIKARQPLFMEIWVRKDVAQRLGIGEYAQGFPGRRMRHARGKYTMCYIDICSKECFINFLEAIKDA